MAKRKPTHRYVIAFEVAYPGDFSFRGRFWRALHDVEAPSAKEALVPYQQVSEGRCLQGFCRSSFMATDFEPAFDVLEFRGEGKFLS